MADDLDRLLDEVERRLCRLPGGRGAAGSHRHGDGEEEAAAAEQGRSAKLLMSAGSSEDDIDDIIDEICNDSSFTKTPLKLKSNSASLTPETNSAVVQSHRKRCCPVYLGGSSSPYGIGTNISKRTCDQLRCTACDFRVSLFNDYIWDQSCDYLFFRNNMPELSKLRAKMIKKKGARAYACQCSWRSIDELTDLRTDQQLRWVCVVNEKVVVDVLKNYCKISSHLEGFSTPQNFTFFYPPVAKNWKTGAGNFLPVPTAFFKAPSAD